MHEFDEDNEVGEGYGSNAQEHGHTKVHRTSKGTFGSYDLKFRPFLADLCGQKFCEAG